MTNRSFRMRGFFLKDLNIRHKLLLSYLVLIVIPMCALALLTYNRSSEIVGTQMMDISSQALDQVNSALGYTFQNAIKSSNIVSANKAVQDMLQRDTTGRDYNAQIDDYKKLSDYLTGIQFDQSVYRIRLYAKDDLLYSHENVNLFSMASIQDSALFRNAVDKDGQLYWSPAYTFKYGGINDTQRIVSGVRVINNREAYGETIGLVSVDIRVSDLDDILNRSSLRDHGLVYIVDGNGGLISRSESTLSPVALTGPGSWTETTANGERVLTAYRAIPYTGWKLAAAIPISSMLKPNNDLRNYTFVSMLVIVAAAYLFSLLISGSLVKRIRRLMRMMRKAEQGDLSAKVVVSGKDEIGEMEDKFNKMLVKLEDLAEERFRIGKESKNAELRALQAQINPHFLYNTLELITCKALKYKADDITVLVNLLAKFYRLSLSKGRDIVSIGDEIAHIETYVGIQNLRFEEGIRLEVEMDDRLADYSILKLVLQPIVENAILHGIMEKEEPTGTIRIAGAMKDGDIVLTVTDDGVGMSARQIERMFKEENRSDGHGFGIINVNRRLKISCGEQYGLTYASAPGAGTTVEVRIPAGEPAYEYSLSSR